MAAAFPISSGHQVAPLPGQDALHQRDSYTHGHSDWDSLDTPFTSGATSLGRGRKPETLEKTHTELGRMCKLHTDNSSAGNFNFSQQYNKTTLIKTAVFEDLLCYHCSPTGFFCRNTVSFLLVDYLEMNCCILEIVYV